MRAAMGVDEMKHTVRKFVWNAFTIRVRYAREVRDDPYSDSSYPSYADSACNTISAWSIRRESTYSS